ncbi:MAG: polyprenyl synthetase family protein, partial [Ilumatobacteraceae bacterium]
MIDRARFVSHVDARLAATIERERGFYGHLADDEIGSVLSSIAGLVASGGKRTRPEFAHLGWIAAGGEESAQTVVNIGAALELLHVSALIHDDIIDGARTRRGAPTIHVGLAADGFDGAVHFDAEVEGFRRRGEGELAFLGQKRRGGVALPV